MSAKKNNKRVLQRNFALSQISGDIYVFVLFSTFDLLSSAPLCSINTRQKISDMKTSQKFNLIPRASSLLHKAIWRREGHFSDQGKGPKWALRKRKGTFREKSWAIAPGAPLGVFLWECALQEMSFSLDFGTRKNRRKVYSKHEHYKRK